MMLSMLLRNVQRNIPKLRPMIFALSAAFAFLYIGNAISDEINSGYEQVYTAHITADGSISPESNRTFTIFGSEALLVGEYFASPIFQDYSAVEEILLEQEAILHFTPIITSTAKVKINGDSWTHPLIGVEFDDYNTLLPEFTLLDGSFPLPGENGALMSIDRLNEIGGAKIGDPVQITVANDNTFTIREVPLAGIYQFPIEDPTLDRIIFIDAESARTLNGYIRGSTEIDIEDIFGDEFFDEDLFGQADGAASTDNLFSTSDDLFSSPDPLGNTSEGIGDIEDLLSTPSEGPSSALETIKDSWNFVLLRLKPGYTAADLRSDLVSSGIEQPDTLLTKGWRQTVGGNAVLIWVVQLLFNAGLIFVAAGASIVTVNALVLSVLERSKEIGTMRAVGATKLFVGFLIGGETIVLVVFSGLIGIACGSIAVAIVNAASIPLQNEVLIGLFGRSVLRGSLNIRIIGEHILLSLGLGIAAVLYPLKKTLGITPVKAITQS